MYHTLSTAKKVSQSQSTVILYSCVCRYLYWVGWIIQTLWNCLEWLRGNLTISLWQVRTYNYRLLDTLINIIDAYCICLHHSVWVYKGKPTCTTYVAYGRAMISGSVITAHSQGHIWLYCIGRSENWLWFDTVNNVNWACWISSIASSYS